MVRGWPAESNSTSAEPGKLAFVAYVHLCGSLLLPGVDPHADLPDIQHCGM